MVHSAFTVGERQSLKNSTNNVTRNSPKISEPQNATDHHKILDGQIGGDDDPKDVRCNNSAQHESANDDDLDVKNITYSTNCSSSSDGYRSSCSISVSQMVTDSFFPFLHIQAQSIIVNQSIS